MSDSPKESEDVDEKATIEDFKRNSQNRMISIFILYAAALLLFFTGRSDERTAFDTIIVIFVIANTLYLLIELIRYWKIVNYTDELIKSE